mmetsp:Transcript_108473/g.291291  ORF Transcript_108473/g.291291 Transcript_108473/m.291291 type:complete len:166 (+) Transcript_108473:348-845(+)
MLESKVLLIIIAMWSYVALSCLKVLMLSIMMLPPAFVSMLSLKASLLWVYRQLTIAFVIAEVLVVVFQFSLVVQLFPKRSFHFVAVLGMKVLMIILALWSNVSFMFLKVMVLFVVMLPRGRRPESWLGWKSWRRGRRSSNLPPLSLLLGVRLLRLRTASFSTCMV